MSIVSNIVYTYLPAKKKTTPSGWISFNAPCCHHNGHAHDIRGRGGLIINGDEGVTYHCFNCGYKCSWQTGRALSVKFKKFLQWINVPDDLISKISLELLRQTSQTKKQKEISLLPTFAPIDLPDDWVCLNTLNNPTENEISFFEYIAKRNLEFSDGNFYYTKKLAYKDRLIIPFYYKNNLVGYTARAINNKIPKYLTQSQPGYVFNLNAQKEYFNYLIVCEGPIDALYIQGVSILGSEISEMQKNILMSFDKEIIVIPDRDKAGKKLYKQALDLGWAVSFPTWSTETNDVADAVNKYGRILTLASIINAKQNSNLKMQLGAKKWFG